MAVDQQLLAKAGIDYEQGLERFLGNEGLYLSFLKKFLNDGSAQAFQEAMTADDLKKAEKDVHTLKGTAGNLSLTKLFQVADETVKALRAGQSKEQMSSLVSEVAKVHEETCEAIRKVVENA